MHPTGNMDVGFSRSAVQTLSRSHCKNIKQKISQWEGRTNGISNPDKWHAKDFGVRYNFRGEILPKKNPVAEGKRKNSDLSSSPNEVLDINEDAKIHGQSEDESEKQEYDDAHVLKNKSESRKVCSQIQQIESWKKVVLDSETSLPPGNFYTSQLLWKKIEALPPDKVLNLALEHCDSSEKELDFRVLDSSYGITKSLENIYSEPEGQECGPSINPLPKPRRTFRYLSESGVMPYKERNCDRKYCENNSCAESSLASSQEPEPKKYGGKIRGRSKRKSFEFEDIQHFRNRNSQKIHELGRNSGSALYYTHSEDNIYEDIIYPSKENPYEDIPVQPLPMWRSPSAWKLPPPKSTFRAPKLPPKPQFLHRKTMELKNSQAYLRSKLTKDTTLPVTLTEWKLFRAGEVANRKRKNLPRDIPYAVQILALDYFQQQHSISKGVFGTNSWNNGSVAGLPCSRLQFESQTRWLKLMRACPRSQEENGGERIAVWPSPTGADFSLSVSLSLWQVHTPYSKKQTNKKQKKTSPLKKRKKEK